MKRWAVMPSPAVGEPAKNKPWTTSMATVRAGMSGVGGTCWRTSGRTAWARSTMAAQPPCWGTARKKKTRLPVRKIENWMMSVKTTPIEPAEHV